MYTIFWPNDVKIAPGRLVGQRVSRTACCVVDVLRSDTSNELDSEYKELVIGRMESSTGCIGGPKIVLWKVNGTQHSPLTYSYIFYTPPNPTRLRYLTLQPISITSPKPLGKYQTAQLRALAFNRSEAESGGKSRGGGEERMLGEALGVINSCYSLRQQKFKRIKTDDPVQGRKTISFERPGYIVEPGSGPASRSELLSPLLRVSAIARQCQLRYAQLRNAPDAWTRLKLDLRPREGEGEGRGLREVSVRYIQFCNTIWLIINDLIFGWTIVRILNAYKDSLVEPITTFQKRWLVDVIQASLRWLDDWPVGLKLNTPLSAILCDNFSRGAEIWGSIWTNSPSLVPWTIGLLTLGSCMGGSMFLSVLQDLIALSTLHLTVISWIMRQIYRWEVQAMYSLWNLFRGKRWNTLRHRVDSYDYEIDQLFLGTLLFTVTIFLLPTIATYYVFFSLVQIALLACSFSIETALAFINSFPLFALMLRIKEPSRLPGGVRLDLKQDRKGTGLGPHLELKNVPLSLGAIFSGFGASWADLSAKYSPARLLLGIVRGVL